MSPSDMVLQIGTIVGYNNKIVIATENQALGFNNDVNVKPVQSSIPPTAVSGTETKKSLPGIDNNQKRSNPVSITEDQKKTQHEDNKSAIIVGSIVIGLASLIIYAIY